MIRIYRSDTIPGSLRPSRIIQQMKKMEDFYLHSSHDRKRQKRFEFDIGPIRAAKDQLAQEFKQKCAYCESPIGNIAEADLEFFRPRSAKGANDEFSNDHYWWLYYEWKNIFYSCQVCNRTKSNWFPVEGKRAPVKMPYKDVIKTEKNLLIDPCNEDPADHLVFDNLGIVTPKSTKGEWTIRILQLNRDALVQERRKAIDVLKHTLELLFKERYQKKNIVNRGIVELFYNLPVQPYVGALRDCLIRELKANGNSFAGPFLNFLGETYPDIHKTDFYKKLKTEFTAPQAVGYLKEKAATYGSKQLTKAKISATRMTIDRMVINNFRAIEDMEIIFPRTRADANFSKNVSNIDTSGNNNWLMLLGENGVGKSSFLQAIVLSLMGSKYLDRLDLRAKDILRRGAGNGFVKIYTTGSEVPIGIEFSKRSAKIISTHTSPQGYLLAYGSTRLLAGKKLKPEPNAATRSIRAMNLFDPSYALYGNQWLVSLYKTNREQFDYAARAIMDILSEELDDPEAMLQVEKGEVIVMHTHRPPDKMKELSDGYKSIIATACDMMSLLLRAGTMESAEGLVVIDEIGTHLHPRWRMRVVESFRKTFPHMQFIATTHDPLCLRGLSKDEVVIFRKDKEDHKIYAITDLPDPSKMRVDQLLTSEFFGLNSVIDPAEEKMLNEYHYLLSRARPTKEQKQRIATLEAALKPYQELGNTWREELLYKAVDEVVAMSKLKMPGQYKVTQQGEDETARGLMVNESPGGYLTAADDFRREAEEEVRARIREMWDKNTKQ